MCDSDIPLLVISLSPTDSISLRYVEKADLRASDFLL
jgi:hypothetical protein